MAEERTSCEVWITELKHVIEDLKKMDLELKILRDKLEELKDQLSSLLPVKNIVYGMVGVILTGFLGALIYLVSKVKV